MKVDDYGDCISTIIPPKPDPAKLVIRLFSPYCHVPRLMSSVGFSLVSLSSAHSCNAFSFYFWQLVESQAIHDGSPHSRSSSVPYTQACTRNEMKTRRCQTNLDRSYHSCPLRHDTARITGSEPPCLESFLVPTPPSH